MKKNINKHVFHLNLLFLFTVHCVKHCVCVWERVGGPVISNVLFDIYIFELAEIGCLFVSGPVPDVTEILQSL